MAENKRECVVQRATGYTVLNNYLLRDKSIGIKAKGLLTVMLSLPEDWDYTIAGLGVILGEGKQVIRSAVQELEKAGYITRQQLTGEGGKFGKNQYIIREIPVGVQEPLSENRTTDENGEPLSGFTSTVKPSSRNCTQINKDQESKDESIPPISPENAEDQPKGKRTRKNRDKAKDKAQPKDLLDDGQLKAVLVAQVDVLSKAFPMDAAQKNRLYKIALHWYAPRTLASKNAAPPVHTELGINNLFRKLERGARVIGIDAAIEVFYDALSRGHTDIHDERFKVGYQGGAGKAPAPAPDDGNGVYKRL